MKLTMEQQQRIAYTLGRYTTLVGLIASNYDADETVKFSNEMSEKVPPDSEMDGNMEAWRDFMIKHAMDCLARLERKVK